MHLSLPTVLAPTIALLASLAMAQGLIQPCTFTDTVCAPSGCEGPTTTLTIYEVPFTATATTSVDCQGCASVTVSTKDCFLGVGPECPVVTATSFDVEPEFTTTVTVCSPTP